MRIIEILAEARGTLSLASISARLQLPKTSVMHLLRSLETAAYVQRTPGGFQLGDASLRLAARIRSAGGFDEVAHPVLHEMREATGETILLGTFAEDRRYAVYTARFSSPQAISFAPHVGLQRPLYATCLGKLLLAFSPDAFVSDYLRRVKMERFTSKTVVTKKALLEQLATFRATGMAVSIDEVVDGGSALAAPVFDQNGKLYCGLVIAAPTTRMRMQRKALESVLLSGASRLSSLLGHVKQR